MKNSGVFKDLSASIVVFLVALPLCLGIALASQAPIVSGLVAGIIGGLIVAPLSGSQLSVSGPAAGLAVLVATSISSLGSFEAFSMAVLIGGLIQILFSIFRGGIIAGLIPNSVIKGLLASIGILIILKQFPHALGWDRSFEGDLGFFGAFGDDTTFSDIGRALSSMSPGALCISITVLGVIAFWEKFVSQKIRMFIPGPLIGVLIGIVLNELFFRYLPAWALSMEDQHLVDLPIFTLGELFSWKATGFPWTRLGDWDVWKIGISIALIGSIETLLSIEATDRLDPQRRLSNKDRELFAQGIGNSVSALFGGLPITSVIVRSSANITAGAQTWLSALFHSIWLLLAVLLLPEAMRLIPLCALAAILIRVGYKLTPVSLFRKTYKEGFTQFIPFLLTVFAIIMTDILTGVFAGVIAGLTSALVTNLQSAITYVYEEDHHLIKFTKDVPFLNKLKLKRILETIPPNSHLSIDGSRAMFIDDDVLETIHDFNDIAHRRNIKVELRNMANKNYPGFLLWKARTKFYGFLQKAPPRE